nr:baseplate J/gp47 family protein [uncultured Sphingomonas sp.]
MNRDRYFCCDEHRREAWRRTTAPLPPPDISGIDYVEVTAGEDADLDPTILEVMLVRPLKRAVGTITGEQVRLSGGVRCPAPAWFDVETIPPASGDIIGYKVTIAPNQPTDFSPYRLSLVDNPASDDPPAFFDPRLSSVEISFKISCPTDADCAEQAGEPPEAPGPELEFDYRTRDYASFRRLVIDRLRALVPGFVADDPSDLTTTLGELIAYRADQQSYRLDWVGTEAFLDTARSRASITRIARLVDYPVGEGSSARLFARFEFTPNAAMADGEFLPAATPVLLREGQLPSVVKASTYKRIAESPAIVFETMAPLQLWQWRNRIAIHEWGDRECSLPRGATAATLVWPGGAGILTAGDLLILVELRSPANGQVADADPLHRHAVRLTRVSKVEDPLEKTKDLLTVEWGEEDRLPFDLVISPHDDAAKIGGGGEPFAAAFGNVMLCDQGMSLPPSPHLGLTPAEVEALRPKLDPPQPRSGFIWQPSLDRLDPARIPPGSRDLLPPGSATAIREADPAACLPAVSLQDDYGSWNVRRDLLKSDPFDREFVVETAMDGRPQFRFGDDVNGMTPVGGSSLKAVGRFGSNTRGNVGAGAIGRVVLTDARAAATITPDNPLAARGGTDPESIEQIRINAPQAFRVQERAVTADDYAVAARRHPDVSNAIAYPRWTGAWQTMVVNIDRIGGKPVDAAFRAALLLHLEHFRLMGFDVRVEGAIPAPLDLRLAVCVQDGELRSDVAGRLRNALRPSSLATGEPGFFHPDHFTFGSPLLLSQLVAAATAVPGVLSVEANLFKRLGRAAAGELDAGVIRPSGAEVLQMSDDPNFPERGRLDLDMRGGR